MPLRKARWTGSSFQTWIGAARSIADPVYVPGVSIPFYEPYSDLALAPKNVGNKAGVTLTTYTGTITNGVASLTDGATYTNILFPCVVDIKNSERLINCRIVVPATYITTADSIKACVRTLNGGTNSAPYLEDCEIHNRAQRPMNGISGRNTTMRRTVITGCVDGWSTSSAGSSPQLYGFDIADCIQPDSAWWYSSTANTDIHTSDTQSHNDGIQHGVSTLRTDVFNTVIGQYVSEIIGTGTPGSGSDAGNTYVPTNYNYIQSQVTQEGWRNTYANTFSTPSQSMWGRSHRLVTSGGSQAAFMINRENFHADKCYIGGGLAAINLMDSNLPTSMDVDITNCVFYNDMRNSAGRAATTKGIAAQATAGKTLTWSGNTWFDGTTANITYI